MSNAQSSEQSASRRPVAFVVSRGVLTSVALPELLRVHLSQLFGIDYRSPRVKYRGISRAASTDPASVMINFKFSVWYPRIGDVFKVAHYRFQADPADGLFFALDDIKIS